MGRLTNSYLLRLAGLSLRAVSRLLRVHAGGGPPGGRKAAFTGLFRLAHLSRCDKADIPQVILVPGCDILSFYLLRKKKATSEAGILCDADIPYPSTS